MQTSPQHSITMNGVLSRFKVNKNTEASKQRAVFTARRYASAVYVLSFCVRLFVRPSVRLSQAALAPKTAELLQYLPILNLHSCLTFS